MTGEIRRAAGLIRTRGTGCRCAAYDEPMSTGRVLWIIWCLAWAGLWAVVSVLAWTGTAAAWQLVLFPWLTLAAVGAITVPVGKRVGRGG